MLSAQKQQEECKGDKVTTTGRPPRDKTLSDTSKAPLVFCLQGT